MEFHSCYLIYQRHKLPNNPSREVYSISDTPSPKNKKNAGFTLIELLIVIAILGVLAAVILVAINPLEQLARGRDAGRKSAIGQLGRAIQTYYSIAGIIPPVGTTWANPVQTSGDLKVVPTNPNGISCNSAGTLGQNGYCYNVDGVVPHVNFIVYSKLESQAEKSKCAGANIPYYIYSSADGKGGTWCGAAGTDPTQQTFGAALLP